jgi:nucleoid-associated protein YgaU
MQVHGRTRRKQSVHFTRLVIGARSILRYSVSASRKLFVAAVLVSTGLGVAYLLGEPVSIRQTFDKPNSADRSQVVFSGHAQTAPSVSWSASRVQLLPEAPVSQRQKSAAEVALLQSPLVPIATPATAPSAADSQTPFAQPMAINASASVGAMSRASVGAPLAKLRNEAPRPFGNEPRSPATIRRTPTSLPEVGDATRAVDPYKAMSSWPASPKVLSTGLAGDANATQAIATAYDTPARVANNISAPAAGPAWADHEKADEPESHIVVDGDSLERLAGRYLDDPHRGAEIYNLNRDVLSNPDVLPIGVELKIPDRTSRTSWDRQSRRMGIQNESSVREAASGNLVPVRPMPSYESVTPRALLAPPIAAE